MGDEKKQKKTEILNEKTADLEKVVKTKETKNEEFKAYDTEDQRIQEDMQHTNQTRKKLQKSIESEKEKVEKLKKVPAENEAAIAELTEHQEKMVVSQKKEEENLKVLMDSLLGETQELQDEKEVHEKELIWFEESCK